MEEQITMDKEAKRGKITLKNCIPAGTEIKDLYGDGDYYYRINNVWIPADFNNFRHPDFIREDN
jgi:hypothetical protein